MPNKDPIDALNEVFKDNGLNIEARPSRNPFSSAVYFYNTETEAWVSKAALKAALDKTGLELPVTGDNLPEKYEKKLLDGISNSNGNNAYTYVSNLDDLVTEYTKNSQAVMSNGTRQVRADKRSDKQNNRLFEASVNTLLHAYEAGGMNSATLKQVPKAAHKANAQTIRAELNISYFLDKNAPSFNSEIDLSKESIIPLLTEVIGKYSDNIRRNGADSNEFKRLNKLFAKVEATLNNENISLPAEITKAHRDVAASFLHDPVFNGKIEKTSNIVSNVQADLANTIEGPQTSGSHELSFQLGRKVNATTEKLDGMNIILEKAQTIVNEANRDLDQNLAHGGSNSHPPAGSQHEPLSRG